MRELAVVVNNRNKEINPKDMIDSIKKAGFNNIFLQWFNEKELVVSQEEQLEYARSIGMNIVFVHLGYKRINEIWDTVIEDDIVNEVVDGYINDLKMCNKYGVDLVIMHLTSKFDAPEYNEKGLERLRRIIKVAEELGIKIAFENTKIRGYLEYVFTNIDSKNIGLCYDAGHCHAHFDDEFNYDFFKDRILAVHLHDNFGMHDEHLLPFDGTINWEDVMGKLKGANYNSYVTLEIAYRNDYLKMTMDEFYEEGYKRGNKLLEFIDKK